MLFGENLKYLRELDGLKQAEMHDAIGFKQSTWNGYERGVSTPNLDDLIVISDFFGILESDLLRTEIPEGDLHQLYLNYIKKQLDPKSLGNTPRSKTFLSYLEGIKWPLAPGKKASIVTESVTKYVTNAPKKREKPYFYDTADTSNQGLFLNEPDSPAYNADTITDTQRIDRIEAILRHLKELLGDL